MRYKSFSLGFICAVVLGCTIGAAMQVVPTQGSQGIQDLSGFVMGVELHYDPPGIMPALDAAGDDYLNSINPGLADEMELYRHQIHISNTGHVVDKIIYVRKTQ